MPITECGNAMRKSAILNQEYKGHLNQLSELADRLEKVRRSMFPPAPVAIGLCPGAPALGKGNVDAKKTPQEMSFLEVWTDHTEYFTLLLDRLANIIQELEQF